MFNKRELTTRSQKLNFLNGLKTGKVSLNEIRGHDAIFLVFKSSVRDLVINEKTGEYLTPDEAQRLSEKTNDHQLVWLEGRRDTSDGAWWEHEKYRDLSIFNSITMVTIK